MTVLVRVCLTCFVLVAAEMTPGDTVLSPSTAHSAEKRLVVLPDASEQLPLGTFILPPSSIAGDIIYAYTKSRIDWY